MTIKANMSAEQIRDYLEGLPKGGAFDLTGKVAIVTGGGTGIGRGISLLLAKYGADVVIASRTAEELENVAKEVRDTTGRKCLPVRTDLKKEEDMVALVQRAIDEFGRIDILVNNAGGGNMLPLQDTPTKLFEATQNLNLRAPFIMIREVSKHMERQGGGNIINISSGAAVRGTIGGAAYSASKAGLNAMTHVAGAELGRKGIRVNAIMVGLVASERSLAAWEQYKVPTHKISAKSPLRRLGYPVDIAYPVLFLASDASAFMSGQVFAVDGGNPGEETLVLD